MVEPASAAEEVATPLDAVKAIEEAGREVCSDDDIAEGAEDEASDEASDEAIDEAEEETGEVVGEETESMGESDAVTDELFDTMDETGSAEAEICEVRRGVGTGELEAACMATAEGESVSSHAEDAES